MPHVLLAGCPPMLRSIIADAVAAHRDVTLITAASTGDASPPPMPDAAPDVVLTIAHDPQQCDAAAALLWQWPRSRVVAVAQSGRDAALWELAPRRTSLGELCPARLVEIIRGGSR